MWKSAKYVQFLAVLTGGFLIANTEVYIFAAKVEWAHFIVTVQVFASKCSFYFKKRVLSFVLNKSTSVSQAPPS